MTADRQDGPDPALAAELLALWESEFLGRLQDPETGRLMQRWLALLQDTATGFPRDGADAATAGAAPAGPASPTGLGMLGHILDRLAAIERRLDALENGGADAAGDGQDG